LATVVSRIIRSIISRRLPFSSGASFASAIVHSAGCPVADPDRVNDQPVPLPAVLRPSPDSPAAADFFIPAFTWRSYDCQTPTGSKPFSKNNNCCQKGELSTTVDLRNPRFHFPWQAAWRDSHQNARRNVLDRPRSAGPMAWNALPDDLRDPSLSADNFRKKLKTHLFRNALEHLAH